MAKKTPHVIQRHGDVVVEIQRRETDDHRSRDLIRELADLVSRHRSGQR